VSRKLQSLPSNDGFFMPAEWSEHKQTWMIWPERTDNWRLGAKPAQEAFTTVIEAIAQFEPVSICASAAQYFNASDRLGRLESKYPIRVIEMSTNDAWCRDTGPTFVCNHGGEVRGIDWTFNAWGGLEGGLYFPWDADDQVASKILAVEQMSRYRTEGFVLEGGSIHVDGEGTLLTSEVCLLNKNRNPHLTRPVIERVLKEYLGVQKIIWIRDGIVDDETDGHIDNMASFVRPGEVLLAWTDDKKDPQYANSQAALEVLGAATDAHGRRLKVHKLPLPSPVYSLEHECASLDASYHCKSRQPGARLAASYVNFYLCNGGLIMPSFDDANDQRAANILQNLFPQHKVIAVPGREILLGGGNVHCITQQQPSG
jgi:agmatine deiminase